MQRTGEPLESTPKRRKPLLIDPHSSDYVEPSTDWKHPPPMCSSAQLQSQTCKKLGKLRASWTSSGSFKAPPHQLSASGSTMRQLALSCTRAPEPPTPDEAGRLTTTNSSGVRQILIIKLNEYPWTLGRNRQADVTIDKPTVSNWHCKLYAIECDTGERIVCLEDLSTNGIRYNGRLVRKKALILNQGDHFEIAGQDFFYTHSCSPGDCEGSTDHFTRQVHFKPTTIEKYHITERLLGSGFFSVVHLAFNIESGAQLACKVIKRQAGRQSAREAKKFQHVVQQEVRLNASLDHPNINKILGLRHDHENIYLFLELVTGGDLFGYVSRNRRLGEDESKFISYQLVLALQYMHDTKLISHRDIKPENILLAHHGPDPRVLLADFGAARLADKAFCSMQGTMSYAAPVRIVQLGNQADQADCSMMGMKEVLTVYTRPQGYDGRKADIWSLGVCIYTMICGFHPFDNGKLESAETERRDFCKVLKYNIEPTEVQFVKSVLRPAGRDEAVKSLSGEVYKEVRDLLKKMFEFDPHRRISAQGVLDHSWIAQSKHGLQEKYAKRVMSER